MENVVPPNPPFAQFTANNQGPAVIVTTYIFLALSVMTVALRVWNRFRVVRKLGLDDWLITVSLVRSCQIVKLSVSLTAIPRYWHSHSPYL